jgi:uncharacterized protein
VIEDETPCSDDAVVEPDESEELIVQELVVNDRTCIVTRQTKQPDELIRFVAGPDGQIVPDIKSVLPGRGCWVTANAETVALAIKRKIFSRALKTEVTIDPDLVGLIERLLVKNALGSLGLLRKSGNLMTGSAKVDDLVRSGKAGFVLHATDGAADGIRKITQGRRATREMGGKEVPGFALFTSVEMSLAFGGDNVIHAAANAGQISKGSLARLEALARYRGTGQLILEDISASRGEGGASDDDYDDDFDDEDNFDDEDEFVDDDMKDEDDETAMKKSR